MSARKPLGHTDVKDAAKYVRRLRRRSRNQSDVTGPFPVEVYVRPARAREKMLVPVKYLAGSGASFCQFPAVRKVLEPSRFLVAAV